MEPIKTPFDILAEIISNPVKWYDRVENEKPLFGLVDQIKPLSCKPYQHRHGTGWDDCEICNCEIFGGGKKVWIRDGETIICHVCNDCFNDPDYQDFIKTKVIIKVENY
jgi:hypothetical protein